MKIGVRNGTNNELVIVNTDPLGKRVAVRCSSCDRVFMVGAAALADGGVNCGCTPLSAKERTARHAARDDLVVLRQQPDWRPGR
jgi:hypothetical protein